MVMTCASEKTWGSATESAIPKNLNRTGDGTPSVQRLRAIQSCYRRARAARGALKTFCPGNLPSGGHQVLRLRPGLLFAGGKIA